ncbi:MAG TPA: CaiB/BaiF CoA-transferase family protein [Thauera sp.]|jgi:alpha-methylacyl-CoA racemase|nr:CaiB/BaiF CoA-transferase family protein [Thauera sp.]HRA80399.1 CaiB/BaiF CoA-transferase family protein [Thauera sp.]
MAAMKDLIVLDLASVGPAARASRLLADFGMQVIKVAPVRAKGAKQVDPVFHAYGAGRGMRRMRVDLKAPNGRTLIRHLASCADVVIESYRPGVAARLGIGHEELCALNPRLVYCSTSGYGQDGPYASWVGHDINYQAVSGYLACSARDADGIPALPGATIADGAGGGMHAALSILAALLERTHSGRGKYLDVSVTDGMLNLMSLYVDQYLATGEETHPGSGVLTGKYAWYGVYAARDGQFVSVGAIEGHFFRNLCKLLDLEQFADRQYDDSAQVEMREAFRARFLNRDRDEWVALLAAADTCVAPVLSVAEVCGDAHLRARGDFITALHPQRGEFDQLAGLLAGSARDIPQHVVPSPEHTDTNEILRAAALSEAEITSLRDEGCIE